jgi:transposase-like protein
VIVVAVRWRYVHRTIDQHGQVIDVLVSARRDAAAARRVFRRALRMLKVTPREAVTDAAPVYPAVLDDRSPRPGITSSGTPTI